MSPGRRLPHLSDAGLEATVAVEACDEEGRTRAGHIAAERPLTLFLDKREIVTLMTLGSHPELLTLGWLRNQRLVSKLERIDRVQVDWESDAVAVTTREGIDGLERRLAHRTVTTGCGQGTVFGRLMDELDGLHLPAKTLQRATLYALLERLARHNEIYRRAGAVHGCALCRGERVELFIEDVGRHNAVDAIAGHMWLHGTPGDDRLFYTTGRLTSEMVIKVAQMGIPILVSRSGITEMGLRLGRQLGVLLIARAKGRHFLVYSGAERLRFA